MTTVSFSATKTTFAKPERFADWEMNPGDNWEDMCDSDDDVNVVLDEPSSSSSLSEEGWKTVPSKKGKKSVSFATPETPKKTTTIPQVVVSGPAKTEDPTPEPKKKVQVLVIGSIPRAEKKPDVEKQPVQVKPMNAWAVKRPSIVEDEVKTGYSTPPATIKPEVHQEVPCGVEKTHRPFPSNEDRQRILDEFKDPAARARRSFRTQACKRGPSCKYPECSFYHSEEERRIFMCAFGSRCNRGQTCKACHPGQEKMWLQSHPVPDGFPKTRVLMASNAIKFITKAPEAPSTRVMISGTEEVCKGMFLAALAAGKTEIFIKVTPPTN